MNQYEITDTPSKYNKYNKNYESDESDEDDRVQKKSA